MSAALNVTEPSACGIGGSVYLVSTIYLFLTLFYPRDAFCLFYDASAKTVKALNGSGHSPQNLTLEYARQRGLSEHIPVTDLNAVTVPGLFLSGHPHKHNHK